MRLLERRRRPCFWVLGDSRCAPSISGANEMVRETSREDLGVSDASLTGVGGRGGWSGEKERGDDEVTAWSRADRACRGSRGQSRFFLLSFFLATALLQSRLGRLLRRMSEDQKGANYEIQSR